MGNTPSTPTGKGAADKPALARPLHQASSAGFRAIADKFTSIEQVQAELRRQGLESSQLILAVDFTKSNEWTGKESFGGKNLHHIGYEPNPYEDAITIIGKTLDAFDSDGLIQAYGFGDASTQDHGVFSFFSNDQSCNGLENLVWRYKDLIPHIRLSGPTSFAPAIRRAMDIVAESQGSYHILLIVADGQVTRGVDLTPDELSTQESETVQAIVDASHYPLSIVMVGIGDGPWEQMREFDDRLPQRQFDNFQFVNFTKLQQRLAHRSQSQREAAFALAALMEVPEQYLAIQRLRLLGNKHLSRTYMIPKDPPGPPSAAPAGNYSYQEPPPAQQPTPRSQSCSTDNLSQYICPITQEVMTDPVIAVDGYTYEREAITSWLWTHNTSPMTNLRLDSKVLTPNHALRSIILEARQRGEIP